MSVADRYFELLIERLAEVRATQDEAIDRAAEACAQSIAADKLVFSFGTGHGSLPALEMFPRTGTIVGFRPIVESTMISFHRVWGDMGARQYRFIHAAEGYGKAILRSHQLDPAELDGSLLALGRQRRDPRHRARGQGEGPHRHRRNVAAAFVRESCPVIPRASACSRSQTSSSTRARACPMRLFASKGSTPRSARIRLASPSRLRMRSSPRRRRSSSDAGSSPSSWSIRTRLARKRPMPRTTATTKNSGAA